MNDNRWTQAEIEKWERSLEEMEEVERWRALHFSPDPYGEFGKNEPIIAPVRRIHLNRGMDTSPIVTTDLRPRYKLHNQLNAALIGLLAMFRSCAVERIRPDIYEGFTYLTPEGILVDITALENSGLVHTRISVEIPDGDSKDYSRIFELNETGKILAARMWVLAKQYDGGMSYELETTRNQ